MLPRAMPNPRALLNIGADLGRDARYLFWGLLAWDFAVGLYASFWTIYIESLKAAPFLVGLLIGGQSIIRISMSLPAGIIADRVSRRRLILITCWIGVPASLIYGLAQVWWQLIPGLILMALTNFSLPALSSYIADAVPARERARAFTLIYTTGPSIAFIISPIIGGILGEAFSLRLLFFITALMFLATTFIFSHISDRPHTAHEGPKASYREAISVPPVRMMCLLQFIVLGMLAIGITLLPNFLQDVHHLNIGEIGRLGAIAPVGSILLSTAISRIRWFSLNRGIALATFSIGTICAVSLLTGNIWLLSLFYLTRGGFMVASSLFTAAAGELAPERLRGRTFALADFMGGAGFGLAPFAAGALYAIRPGVPLFVTAAAAPFLVLLILWVEQRYVAPLLQTRLEAASPSATPATVSTHEPDVVTSQESA
jgi:MFS family permease